MYVFVGCVLCMNTIIVIFNALYHYGQTVLKVVESIQFLVLWYDTYIYTPPTC